MNMNVLNYDNHLTNDFEDKEEEAAKIEEARQLIYNEHMDNGYSDNQASNMVEAMSNNAVRSWIIDQQKGQY